MDTRCFADDLLHHADAPGGGTAWRAIELTRRRRVGADSRRYVDKARGTHPVRALAGAAFCPTSSTWPAGQGSHDNARPVAPVVPAEPEVPPTAPPPAEPPVPLTPEAPDFPDPPEAPAPPAALPPLPALPPVAPPPI